eukprot:GHVU01097481.1.p1 GENE.GHVU01097481.1~~GHVU01097481.1.p1  ORF type:complete len:409 (-),score=67.68 GHVU01097481.1:827-2053(-)
MWLAFERVEGGTCVMHCGDLIVKAYCGHAAIAVVYKKLKATSAHFHRSVIGSKHLTTIQIARGLRSQQPPRAGGTRWKYPYEMVVWAAENEQAVKYYHQDKPEGLGEEADGSRIEQHKLTEEEWALLPHMRSVLYAFHYATTHLEATRHPTKGLVMPAIAGATMKLKTAMEEATGGAADAARFAVNEVYRRFDEMLLLGYRQDLYICTLLDPRFRNFAGWPTKTPAYDLQWGLGVLRDAWRRHFKEPPAAEAGGPARADELTLQQAAIPEPQLTPPAVGRAARKAAEPSLVDFAGVHVAATPVGPAVVDELEEYLAEGTVDADLEPTTEKFSHEGIFRYWERRQKKWPRLTRMWRQYSASPASTAGVERLFSKVGLNRGNLQKRITEPNLEVKVKAGVNDKLVQFLLA